MNFNKTISIILLVTLLLSPNVFALTSQTNFPDVSKSHWAHDSILWALDNGVVTGYPNGTFQPDNNVTEVEFLIMLTNAYKVELGPGSDNNWTSKFYDYAIKMNWNLRGVEDKIFRNTIITRGDVAFIVNYSLGINYTSLYAAIDNLYKNNLSSGKTAKTIDGFLADDNLTRAESVMFIQNMTKHIDKLYSVEIPNEEIILKDVTPKINYLDFNAMDNLIDVTSKKYGIPTRILEYEDWAREYRLEDTSYGTYASILIMKEFNLLSITISHPQHSVMSYELVKEIFGESFTLENKEFYSVLNTLKGFMLGEYSINLIPANEIFPDVTKGQFTIVISK